eukprot:RCo026917
MPEAHTFPRCGRLRLHQRSLQSPMVCLSRKCAVLSCLSCTSLCLPCEVWMRETLCENPQAHRWFPYNPDTAVACRMALFLELLSIVFDDHGYDHSPVLHLVSDASCVAHRFAC